MSTLFRRLFNRPRPETTTAIQSFATFRYGQDITEDDIERAIRRVPLIVFAGMIIPKKAIGVGLEIVNKDDKIQEELTAEWHKLKWLSTLIRGVQHETNFGAVAFSIHKPFEKKPADGTVSVENSDRELILKVFRPKFIDVTVNEFGLLEQYCLREKIDSPEKPEIFHNIPEVDEDGKVTGKPEELDNVIFRCLRPGDVWWRGHPKWEPLWDVGRSHYSSLEAIMVGNVRKGYGQKTATLWDRGDGDENLKVKTAVEKGMRNLDSGDTSIVMYSIVDSQGNVREDKIDVDFGDSQYDHASDIDSYHKVASFLLSVPKNVLDGIFAGETLAGDTIYRWTQEAMHEFREDWIEPFNSIAKRWCELTGKTWADDFTFRFRIPKAKLTEREEAEIENIEATSQATLKNSGIIDTTDARTKLNIEPVNKEIEPEEEDPININFKDDLDEDEQNEEEE